MTIMSNVKCMTNRNRIFPGGISMIHTKMLAGIYDVNDYKEVVYEYVDCDNAYEDYCYYKNKW